MSIALIGLISFQLYWINSALKLNSERFKQHVFESMQNVALKLEKHRIAGHLERFVEIEADSGQFLVRNHFIGNEDTIRLRKGYWTSDSPPKAQREQNISLRISDSTRSEGMVLIKESISKMDSNLVKRLNKSQVVDLVITQMAVAEEEGVSIPDQRVLDSLLHEELHNKGINIKFQYVVTNQDEDSVLLANFPYERDHNANFEYRTSLTPNDLLGNLSYLALNFPSQNQFLFKQIWVTLASSVVLLLIIIFCFIYALNTIIRQKKLSEIKNDFINNMTHEFKTPVATISLASEALKEEEVYGDKLKFDKYVEIISEENRRLGTQVEKVLQSAKLDKGEYKLNLETINLNELLKGAIDNFNIKVQSREGKLELETPSNHVLVNVDEHHLLNAINNLLDNAEKYSPQNPEITVSMKTTGSEVIVSVTDSGLGLTKDSLRRIFDKFYRVSTGDVHDVKGFGLGLSYVNAVIKLLGGRVKAESTIGKGSTFSIVLPYHE
jgi:two-component system phosphate regulon sensor histidine kinase PhoR